MDHAKVKELDPDYELLEDHRNPCGDIFRKGERLVKNKMGQLIRIGSGLGSPSVVSHTVVEKTGDSELQQALNQRDYFLSVANNGGYHPEVTLEEALQDWENDLG